VPGYVAIYPVEVLVKLPDTLNVVIPVPLNKFAEPFASREPVIVIVLPLFPIFIKGPVDEVTFPLILMVRVLELAGAFIVYAPVFVGVVILSAIKFIVHVALAPKLIPCPVLPWAEQSNFDPEIVRVTPAAVKVKRLFVKEAKVIPLDAVIVVFVENVKAPPADEEIKPGIVRALLVRLLRFNCKPATAFVIVSPPKYTSSSGVYVAELDPGYALAVPQVPTVPEDVAQLVTVVQAPAVIAFQYINLFYYKYHEYVILPVLFQIAFDAV
jgi:hypothetical protein